MGSYIKSTDDRAICDMLTRRFSDAAIPPTHPAHVPGHPTDTFIGQMRRHRGHENIFDGTPAHPLDRVSHRLAHSLGNGAIPATQPPRLRWHWLLNAASNQLPAATAAAICDVLQQVLAAGSTVDLVTFDAQVAATASGHFELHPGNSHTPQIVVQSGKRVCLMVLDCPADQQLPNPSPGLQRDPPVAPGPETPLNNVHVP